MIYESIHNLIRDTVGSVGMNLYFYHGGESNLNAENKERYPLVWLLPVDSNLSFINDVRTNDTARIQMLFLNLDKVNKDTTHSNSIIFEMDKIAREFILNLNERTQDIDIVIDSIQIRPFIKVKASVLTGVALTFNLTSPDDVVYC